MTEGITPDAGPALTPPVFYILLALAEGERHGDAIMQETALLSGGNIHLAPHFYNNEEDINRALHALTTI